MEEEETCRICRSGAEEEMPLYHPCRCSGSIAKVHQDCLIDWLQHSKKKSCELCSTELRFHKVYSPTMPDQLPFYLYLRRFLIKLLLIIPYGLRTVSVIVSWLALLPLMNLGIWRLHFVIVDVIVWALIGGAPPSSKMPPPPEMTDSLNATMQSSLASNTTQGVATSMRSSFSGNASSIVASQLTGFGIPFPLLFVERLLMWLVSKVDYKKTLDMLGRDTFEGQILTCAIVIFFVAIFLLREWCLQNLPQPVEGLAFAGARIPAPDAQQDLPMLLPAPPQIAGLIEAPPPAPEIIDEADRVAPMRPRLQHGVPDPPELMGAEEDWRDQTRLAQNMGSIEEEDTAEVEEIFPTSLDDLRRKRAARFGLNLDDDEEASGANREEEKGKGREEDQHQESLLYEDAEQFEAGPSSKHPDREEHSAQPQNEVLPAPSLAATTKDEDQSSITSFHDTEGGDLDGEDSQASIHEEEEEEQEAEEEREAERRLEEEQHIHVVAPRDDAAAAAAAQAGAEGGLLDAGDWEDDAENGERLGDDLDGMLEAIGLRGPLLNLVTNLSMMFVLCSFVLTIAVALPYLIGRLIGVGTNLVKLFSLPLRGIRFFSDPVVDFIVHQSAKAVRAMWQNASSTIVIRSIRAVVEKMPSMQKFLSSALVSRKAAAAQIHVKDEGRTSLIVLRSLVLTLISNGKHFARGAYASTRTLFILAEAKTQGVSQRDKIFCIVLGHCYWLIGLVIQKRLSNVYIRWNLRWLKASVDQQLIVLKVLAFIVLELVVFPWSCGVLWDAALFPLWESVTPASRWAMLKSMPISVAFTQWSLGTLYMFALAQFVANTRGIVRPGVLCFVRDAGDPNFHPIKDILERRSLEQLRKIGVSGVIYAGILAGTVGFCSWLVYLTDKVLGTDVLPLRWEVHQPLTTSGFELLFIAIALPTLIQTCLPTHILRRTFKAWWRKVAHHLRLSSYLLGGRHPDEEGRHVYKTWKAALLLQRVDHSDVENEKAEVRFVKDGGYGRVPADDRAIMSSPIIIRTNESGEPLTERGKEALQAQQEAIDKLTKKPHYTVVYLPPHFRPRIIALIATLWASVLLTFTAILFAPLLIGRAVFGSLFDPVKPLHDGYSWFCGAIVLGAASQVLKTARKLIKSSNVRRRALRLARKTGAQIWALFFLVTTSALFGICIELYFNMFARPYWKDPSASMPDISLLHATTMGMILQHIIVQIMDIQRGGGDVAAAAPPIDWNTMPISPTSGFHALLDLQTRNSRGIRVWHIWPMTKRGFLPALAFYSSAIIFPFALNYTIRLVFGRPSTPTNEVAQTSLLFAFCFALCLLYLTRDVWARMADRWTISIRDEIYLVSTQLKNYSSIEAAPSGQEEGAGDPSHLDIPARAAVDEGPLPDVILHG